MRKIIRKLLYATKGEEEIYSACLSKNNSNHEKQVVLIISNREGWHYLALIQLSSLLRGVTSTYNGNFYCLNCFYLYGTENNLEWYIKVCQNKEFFRVVVPSKDTRILKFTQYY